MATATLTSAAMVSPSSSTIDAASGLITPAVTATLSPNSQCIDNHITMLAALQNEVWLNEPHPISNVTLSSCYASAVVSSLVAASTTSLAPISPMLGGCANVGDGYMEVLTGASGYVACCPTNYLLHTMSDAPSSRPALSATCYSNMPSATTTVTVWATNGQQYLQAYYNPAAQAYAHVIDGYPTNFTSTSTSMTSSFSTQASSTSSATSSTTTSSDSSAPAAASHASLTGGQIGGIVAGIVIVALLILGLAFLLLRRRARSKHSRVPSVSSTPSFQPYTPYTPYSPYGDTLASYQTPAVEMAESGYSAEKLPEQDSPHSPAELPTSPPELPGSGYPYELSGHDASTNKGFGRLIE